MQLSVILILALIFSAGLNSWRAPKALGKRALAVGPRHLPYLWAGCMAGISLATVLLSFLGKLGTTTHTALVGITGLAGALIGYALSAPILLALNLHKAETEPKDAVVTSTRILVVVITLVTLAAGFLLPPNNWDSMTYHLSRIMSWLSQGNLDYYPTPDSRQLYQPPLAEWVQMAVLVLDGHDRGVFLVQWWSYVSALILSTQLLKSMGVPARVKWLTVGLLAATPMAVLQSATSQNDMVMTFWLLLGTTMWIWVLKLPNALKVTGLFWALGALVLAFYTKGTAVMFVAGLLVGIALWWGREIKNSNSMALPSSRHMAWAVLPTLVLFLLLATVTLYPNQIHTGNWQGLSPQERAMYQNTELGVGTVVANGLRNLGQQLGLPGLDKPFTAFWAGAVEVLTGYDASDPAITFGDQKFKAENTTHEDTATGFLQTVLMLWGGAVVLVRRKALPSWVNELTPARFWLGLALVSVLLFTLLLKWQPWHGRLHLVFFFLLGPWLTALGIHKMAYHKVGVWVLVLFTGTGIWFALKHDNRQLGNPQHWKASGFTAYYVNNKGDQAAPLDSMLSALPISIPRGSTVTLVRGGDDWDYPIKLRLYQQGYQFRYALPHTSADSLDVPAPALFIVKDKVWFRGS